MKNNFSKKYKAFAKQIEKRFNSFSKDLSKLFDEVEIESKDQKEFSEFLLEQGEKVHDKVMSSGHFKEYEILEKGKKEMVECAYRIQDIFSESELDVTEVLSTLGASAVIDLIPKIVGSISTPSNPEGKD